MASPGTQQGIIRFGPFKLDPVNGELRKSGISVKLLPQQFAVLWMLPSGQGRSSPGTRFISTSEEPTPSSISNVASTSPSTRFAPHWETIQPSRVISRPFPAADVALLAPLRPVSQAIPFLRLL
jgi:hypothetical protein